jgi:hypothetical protein
MPQSLVEKALFKTRSIWCAVGVRGRRLKMIFYDTENQAGPLIWKIWVKEPVGFGHLKRVRIKEPPLFQNPWRIAGFHERTRGYLTPSFFWGFFRVQAGGGYHGNSNTSDIQDSSLSSDNKIQQFYYKRIYIERGMLIGSFCSHTLDTAKCNKQKKNKNRSKYYYMIRSRNFLRSDRPKYHLGYHNVKYLASYPGLISEFSEQFTQHCYIYALSNLG